METQLTHSSYIKKTALYDFHIDRNAKMVEFAGWEMPVQYTSILEEAKHIRNGTGIFDISHMGEIFISGRDRVSFLEYLTTNNIEKVAEGQMQYTLCCNAEGGILDDIMVYNLGNALMCITNASNTHTVFMHFLTHSKNFNVTIEDKSREMSLIALQGIDAETVLEKIFERDFSHLFYMNVERFKYNTNEVICSRSGYTGEDGFEIYMDNMTARMFWNGAITDEEIKIAPCGLGSRDILRLEMGYSLYGVDIDTTTNPAAANLAWAVKETRKDFIGKDAIYTALQQGVPRKKIGFVMQEKSFPRYGYSVFSTAGKEIGVVRSGLYSPNLDKFIGTAYVDVGFTQTGAPLQIEIRDKKYSARVEKFPLIKPKVKRKELR